MQLLDNTIKLKGYLAVDIKNDAFDDVEDATAELDITFSMELSNSGILIDVHRVKAVKWSYTGVKWSEEQDEKENLSGASDDSWKINVKKRKSDDDNYGLFINDIYINLVTKEIDIDFEC